MKLVFLIGNAAVGKMTVGQELMKITDLRLFHNHMTIEPAIEIFGEFNKEIIKRWRHDVFEVFAKSDKYGLIFTYMWAFNTPSDWAYVEYVKDIFEKHNADIYFIELIASKEVRLKRNKTENRLNHKASKRDLEASEQRVLRDDSKYRLVSNPGEISHPNYLRIDTDNLEAIETAKMIKKHFDL